MYNRPESALVDDADERGGASPSELLTADEVIDRLLEDANLRRVAAMCVLPAVRVGAGWRFRRTDLDDWIRQQAHDEG